MGAKIQWVSAKILDQTLKSTGLTNLQLSSELGITSVSTFNKYQRDGLCPATVAIACRTVQQKYRGTVAETEVVLWVKVPEDEREFLISVLDKLGAKHGSVSEL